MRSRSVLVSGAGIAGPTLAYWLSRRGFTPTLIERAPLFREGGYMIDFWGVGFDVADRMGLVPFLRQVGYNFDRIKFVDENDRVRSEFGGHVLREALGERFISLQRGDLAKAIFNTVAENIEVIFDDSVVALCESSSAVEVRFEKSGCRRFDLVAGCDGLHSTVRKLAFGPEAQFEKYLGFYAASFVIDDYPRREELTYLSYSAPDGRSAVMRCEKIDLPSSLYLPATILSPGLHTVTKPKQSCGKCLPMMRGLRFPRSWSKWNTAMNFILIRSAKFGCRDGRKDEQCWWAMRRIAPRYSQEKELLSPWLAVNSGGRIATGQRRLQRCFRGLRTADREFIDRKQRSAESLAASFAPSSRWGLWLRDFVLRSANLFPPMGKWLMQRFVSDHFELSCYPE